ELVDPDANIIWGSAFNPELEGKIRVSVVATAIEAEEGRPAAAPEQPRVFSFSTPRRAPEPAGFEPEPEPVVAEEPVAEAAFEAESDLEAEEVTTAEA